MGKVFGLFVATLVLCGTGTAGVVTLTFGELPQQSVDGLSYQGVTFGFTEGGTSSSNAIYDFITGAPLAPKLTDPVLDGPSDGTLTLTFATPTPILAFDVALAITSTQLNGVTVQLFGPQTITPNPVNVETDPLVFLSEGSFSYNNAAAPITQAVITFSQADSNPAFALDNLTFDPPDPAPEPGTLSLVGSGALLLGVSLRARRLRTPRQPVG